MKPVQKRLFMGNLPPKLLKCDVVNMLQEFGNVQSVEMKQRADDDGNILSSFAFVDIEMDTDKLYSCFRRFQSESWGDHKIKVEVARESFLDRLKREQAEAKLSESKMKKSGVNGNLYHNHSVGLYENHEETKDNTAPCVKSEDKVEKKNSKASKVRKDLKQKSSFVDDDSFKPKVEKSSDLESDEASNKKKMRKRFGVLSRFSGTKDVKNHDDSESNVQDDNTEDCLQSVEEEKEKRKSYGNLPMFSGTMNMKDMNSSVEVNGDSRSKKKRSAEVLSSPAKRIKSESLSVSEMKPTPAINECTSIEQSVDKNKFSKGKDINLEEKRKKKSKTERKAEEKRLNALEERNKAFNLQKEAVKKALSSVDVKTNPNKIVFDDEDSEDDKKVTVGAKSANEQIKEPSKPKLFEDSSDDEELKYADKKEFKIKPQFEGPKGQKLLEIQSRYGNDTRFNLDERFLESGEETGPEEEEGDGDEKEDDLNAEKAHQLSILQDILGIDVSTKPARKEFREKRKAVPMVRFDPSNPEHSKYLLKEEGKEKDEKKEPEKEQKKTKKKKKEEMENVEEEKKVPTSTERFYEVSDVLKESLKKRTEKIVDSNSNYAGGSKGFSLLKTFGSAPSDSEKEEEEAESYSTRPIKGGLHEWDKNPFKYDSSDEEEEDITHSKESESDKVSDTKNSKDPPPAPVERFHLREDDPRLEEGLAFFRVDKTFEEMKEGFQEKRTDLKSIIKAKLKNNKKKKLPFRKKLGGLRRKFPKGRR